MKSYLSEHDDTLGGRVYHARMASGQTQAELADVSGIPLNAVSLLENNKRSPSVKMLERLRQAWPRINLHWIITGEGEWIA